jgi:hypothetical protein
MLYLMFVGGLCGPGCAADLLINCGMEKHNANKKTASVVCARKHDSHALFRCFIRASFLPVYLMGSFSKSDSLTQPAFIFSPRIKRS